MINKFKIKCLKGAFIGVNIILAIIGLLFIALASLLHYFMQAQDMDISLLWELFGLWGGGIVVATGFGIYGASKNKTWPLTAFITATLIGVVVFLMQGVQAIKLNPVVMKYMKHYVKFEDTRKAIAVGLDAGLGAMFALAALEVFVVILAAVIIHQQRRNQTAIPDPTSEGAKPPAYSKLCPITPSTNQTPEDSYLLDHS
ncbi:hypothetical protein ACEWY4_016912 [Coilia grayii]|uniref:Tetraspanin n=1 Tax=Coilia grayii TaxID=363190 RepID=A0ABD1JLQ9_9TELE